MLYLNIFHIDQYARHLKANNVTHVYLSHDIESADSAKTKFDQVTMSARVDDYIAVCTFGTSPKPDSSMSEQIEHLKERTEWVKERLADYGLQVTLGHWTTETPSGLKSG